MKVYVLVKVDDTSETIIDVFLYKDAANSMRDRFGDSYYPPYYGVREHEVIE